MVNSGTLTQSVYTDRAPDDLLIKARDMEGFQRPSDQSYNDVRRWILENKPLVRDEWDSINYKEDILTLRQEQEPAHFDYVVEAFLLKLNSNFTRVYPLASLVRLPIGHLG